MSLSKIKKKKVNKCPTVYKKNKKKHFYIFFKIFFIFECSFGFQVVWAKKNDAYSSYNPRNFFNKKISDIPLFWAFKNDNPLECSRVL